MLSSGTDSVHNYSYRCETWTELMCTPNNLFGPIGRDTYQDFEYVYLIRSGFFYVCFMQLRDFFCSGFLKIV